MTFPLIIAHRGASEDAPENTLAAVRLAWDQGADAVEVDVQRTRDRRLVVFHDEETARITGREGSVARRTLAQLERLDAGRWKSREFEGERVPSLDRVLGAVPPGKRVLVEIKGGVDCVPPFVRAVRRSGRSLRQVMAIAFSLEVLRAIRVELPDCETAWVIAFRRSARGRNWRPSLTRALGEARDAQIDGLDVSAHSPWSRAWVDRIRKAGLKLYVWTVDDARLANRLARLGVDGLTTNRPGWLRARLTTDT